MRTSKPVATISYNSEPYLYNKLHELISQRKICDFMFITHFPESDERKAHIHLWIKPNTLIDTMQLQDFFREIDLSNPSSKPLGCIDFRSSQIDDWILYSCHYQPYLASKGESREYHYDKSDFIFYDEDTFLDNWAHAFKGSEWARRNQILQALADGTMNPTELILNGTVPLQMASQLSAFKYMQRNSSTLDRGSRNGHV